MKALFSLLAFCLSLADIAAQGNFALTDPPEHYHTVYQVRGTILRGEITEWNIDYVRLRLLSDVEVTIPSTQIKRITSHKTPVRTVLIRDRSEKRYEMKEKGVYQAATLVASAGPAAGVGLTHAVGYRFSRMISAGGGIGVESYEVGSGNIIFPVFAEFRGFVLPSRFSPYYAVRAGYGFASKNSETSITEAKGGTMIGAEFGYRFGASKNLNVFAGVGVHIQKATYRYDLPWEERFTDHMDFRRTELKLGVLF
jgi:hypothetical protein